MSMIDYQGQLIIRENPPERIKIQDQPTDVLVVREVGAQGPPGDPGITVSPTPPINPTLNQLWINSA